MGGPTDFLEDIVRRKRAEIARRRRWIDALDAELNPVPFDTGRGERAVAALRREAGRPPKVIAEVKFRSPSRGELRPRAPGEAARLAEAYARGGASVVSVLADGPGFGGSVLDVRRVANRVPVPVLFKEFVLDECQVRWARAAGASLVLLIVKILSDDDLVSLVDATRRAGLEPVVEVTDGPELARALRAGAAVVGVNARDLRSFAVDRAEAERLVAQIPSDRVRISMSGITSREELWATGADAVLVGEAPMRAADPAALLAGWLATSA